MGQDGADRTTSNLKLAQVLIPPEGNDWGAVIRDKAAEAAFMARVRASAPAIRDRLAALARGI
jgi:hypothetical protein